MQTLIVLFHQTKAYSNTLIKSVASWCHRTIRLYVMIYRGLSPIDRVQHKIIYVLNGPPYR